MAENVLDRDLDPDEPNTSWVADVTYVPTREGWLDLAVVVDLFSRLVAGWSMAATMASRLVADALDVAVSGRGPEGSSGLVAHSDRGSQSASETARCTAPRESFLASLKKELVHDEDYATRDEATASIFETIEASDNRVRRHSSRGYVAPAESERTRHQTHREKLSTIRGELHRGCWRRCGTRRCTRGVGRTTPVGRRRPAERRRSPTRPSQ